MTLNIKNLHAGYGAKEILCNVSIPEIKFGYFVGLIGPNASGKSTFFKVLSGELGIDLWADHNKLRGFDKAAS